MLIGERIRKLRKKQRITQAELAQKISLNLNDRDAYSRQAVSLWEQGDVEPKSGSLQALALALGVSVDYLLNGPTDPNIVPNGYLRVFFYDSFNEYILKGTNGGSHEDVHFLDLPAVIFPEPHSDKRGDEIFAVKVTGTSMEPGGIRNGSYLFVNPAAEIVDGDVALVELDGSFMLKYIFFNRRGGGGELHSASTGYPIKRFSQEDIDDGSFKIFGKAVLVSSEVHGRKL